MPPEKRSFQAVLLIGFTKISTDWGFRNVSCSVLVVVLFRSEPGWTRLLAWQGA